MEKRGVELPLYVAYFWLCQMIHTWRINCTVCFFYKVMILISSGCLTNDWSSSSSVSWRTTAKSIIAKKSRLLLSCGLVFKKSQNSEWETSSESYNSSRNISNWAPNALAVQTCMLIKERVRADRIPAAVQQCVFLWSHTFYVQLFQALRLSIMSKPNMKAPVTSLNVFCFIMKWFHDHVTEWVTERRDE